MPALLIRTSRRCDLEVKSRAAEAMEAKEVRSRLRREMLALGTAALSSARALDALEGVRAAR